jgi:hypothetical protein
MKFAIFNKFSKKTSPGTGHIEICRYKACVHKTVKQKNFNETSGTEFYYFAEEMSINSYFGSQSYVNGSSLYVGTYKFYALLWWENENPYRTD